jgi:hypothetical protein
MITEVNYCLPLHLTLGVEPDFVADSFQVHINVTVVMVTIISVYKAVACCWFIANISSWDISCLSNYLQAKLSESSFSLWCSKNFHTGACWITIIFWNQEYLPSSALVVLCSLLSTCSHTFHAWSPNCDGTHFSNWQYFFIFIAMIFQLCMTYFKLNVWGVPEKTFTESNLNSFHFIP